jgi:hypothetical protein
LLTEINKNSKHQKPNSKWFDKPFDGLTVLSNVEGHTTLSQVEGQISMAEIQNGRDNGRESIWGSLCFGIGISDLNIIWNLVLGIWDFIFSAWRCFKKCFMDEVF